MIESVQLTKTEVQEGKQLRQQTHRSDSDVVTDKAGEVLSHQLKFPLSITDNPPIVC